MARITDVPHVFRTVGAWGFAKRVYNQISEDLAFTWAAALAYSWMFAVFPFFIFLLTLAPYLPYNTKETATREVNQFIDRTMPQQAGAMLRDNVERVMNEPRGGLLSIGLLLTIWAASGGMAMTMRALDIAYDVDKPRPFWKQRLIAVGLTIVVAILILAVMLLLPVGTLVINWLDRHELIFGFGKVVLNIARYTLALILLFVVLALIYYYGPSIRSKFHVITPGAIFAVTVWLILAFAFRFYVNNFGQYDRMYGTVGGVVILLLLFYVDALVLLAGAEINSEIDFVSVGIPSTADQTPQQAAAEASPEQDEEKQELARELQSKRREDLAASPIGKPPGGELRPEPAAAPQPARGGRWMTVLATLGVILLIDKLRPHKQHQRGATAPDQLRKQYPSTYAMLSSRDGAAEPTNGAHAPEASRTSS